MSAKTLREIANDLQVVKHEGRFPKGRAHKYAFYKREGIVKMWGYKTKDKSKYFSRKTHVVLTKKGKAMFEQLKGVI